MMRRDGWLIPGLIVLAVTALVLALLLTQLSLGG